MSLKNTNKPEKNVVELELIIAKDAFEAEILKVYKKNAPKINVPGFRKGKAPKSIVEKLYGKGVFYDDALNAIIPGAYEEALKESKVQAVSQPEFDVTSIDDNGVVITAKVFVKPEVEIKDYKGIAVDRVVVKTTDEEVNAQVEATRNRNSRTIEVTDRATQNGDIANIDYEGFCDGVAFDGGKGENHDLKLGSGSFIPGFEEQVEGHTIGEEFDVNVKFPEEYHSADLAGKDATFKVKLNAIKYTELPELDDDFAKDVSEFDTIAEYIDSVKAKITERHESEADRDVENKLIDALVEKLEADIPECMFENETENQLRDYANRLSMQGLSLDMYLKYTGFDLDTLRAEFKPTAEKHVKTRLALEKIADLENIDVTDEDVEKEYETIANAYGMEVDKIKPQIDAEMLKEDVKVRKAVELVKAAAVITDKEPEAEKTADAE